MSKRIMWNDYDSSIKIHVIVSARSVNYIRSVINLRATEFVPHCYLFTAHGHLTLFLNKTHQF